MLQEFKAFAMKGNVVDLAIGVIIGAAFGLIVSSLVADIIMPIIGMFGSVDFNNMYTVLKGTVPAGATLEAAQKSGAVVLAYGKFLTIVVNFLIIAFVLFMLVRAMNKAKKAEAEAPKAPEPTPANEVLLAEIRDLLKK
jgi:large conductance mechanosensitive channel